MNITIGSSFVLPMLNESAKFKKQAMLWVPSGTFVMGSSPDEIGYYAWEDGLPFPATLSRGFWLGQYHVTQAFWETIMKENPSYFQHNSPDCPVESVSWDDAIMFCDELNHKLVSILPASYTFSLPTETQWEYACRAGTRGMYYSGDSESDLSRVAWWSKNSDNQTHPVGEKEPNDWEFYDMHGNVSEWCCDDESVDRNQEPTTGSIGKSKTYLSHIYRGGSWNDNHNDGGLRSASSPYETSDSKKSSIGFRLCLRWTDSL